MYPFSQFSRFLTPLTKYGTCIMHVPTCEKHHFKIFEKQLPWMVYMFQWKWPLPRAYSKSNMFVFVLFNNVTFGIIIVWFSSCYCFRDFSSLSKENVYENCSLVSRWLVRISLLERGHFVNQPYIHTCRIRIFPLKSWNLCTIWFHKYPRIFVFTLCQENKMT